MNSNLIKIIIIIDYYAGEALDNSGDTLVSLDEDLAGVDGSKPSHGVINMHHVDMILDNIDAELHNIINRVSQ